MFDEVKEIQAFNAKPLLDDDGEVYGFVVDVYVNAASGEYFYQFEEGEYHRNIKSNSYFNETIEEEVSIFIYRGTDIADRVMSGAKYEWSERDMHLALKSLAANASKQYQIDDQHCLTLNGAEKLGVDGKLGLIAVNRESNQRVEIFTHKQLLNVLNNPAVEIQRHMYKEAIGLDQAKEQAPTQKRRM